MLITLKTQIPKVVLTETNPVLAKANDSILHEVEAVIGMEKLNIECETSFCGVYPTGNEENDFGTFNGLSRAHCQFTAFEHFRAIEQLAKTTKPSPNEIYFCLHSKESKIFFDKWTPRPIKMIQADTCLYLEGVVFIPSNLKTEDGIHSAFYFGEDILDKSVQTKKALRVCYKSLYV